MHLHSWRLVAHSLLSLPELNRLVAPINRIPVHFGWLWQQYSLS